MERNIMAIIQLKVPNWLDRICAWPVLVYRQCKFGYSFRKIYLDEGYWSIVDSADYYLFGNFKWTIGGHGTKCYAVRGVRNGTEKITTVRLHRMIMNAPKGLLVDHANGDTLDNRRTNLRLATHFQNTCNRQKTKSKTSSRFIGVYFEKERCRWVVHIRYQGKRKFLGRFTDELEAARAYDVAAKKYHGEFAKLNFNE
jgi:hypothetical protein